MNELYLGIPLGLAVGAIIAAFIVPIVYRWEFGRETRKLIERERLPKHDDAR